MLPCARRECRCSAWKHSPPRLSFLYTNAQVPFFWYSAEGFTYPFHTCFPYTWSSSQSPPIFPLSSAVMEKKSFSERSNKNSSSTHTDDVDRPRSRAIEPIDIKAEKRLLRKCDLHVLPPLCILYVLCFIDRINIGNARIQGLEKSLNMKDNDFNIALLVFFPFYILCEVPSNVLIRKFAPSTWLTMLMVAWGKSVLTLIGSFTTGWSIKTSGIITICTGLTKSFAGLLICRILLGLCEAGFFPGNPPDKIHGRPALIWF